MQTNLKWRLSVAAVAGVLVLAIGPAVAHADDAPASAAKAAEPLTVDLKGFRVSQEGGKEVLVPAANVAPGDVIEYQARYTNVGQRALRNIEAQMPVPEGTQFIAGSAEPKAMTPLIADGAGSREDAEGKLRPVTEADGAVKPEQYKALRWTVPELSQGAYRTVSMRVRVMDTVSPAQAASGAAAGSGAATN
jgi:uncharacterized repeat protein (TIGR01451 family)